MSNNNYNFYIKYLIAPSVFIFSAFSLFIFFTGPTQAATECIGQWPSSQMSVTVRYDNSSGPVIGTYTNPADSDGYSIRNFTINNVQTGRRLHFSGTATAPDQNAPSSVNYPYNQNQSFSEGFITWTRNWTSSREIDSNTSFHWDIIGNCNAGSPPFNWDGGYAEINIAINIATAPPPPPPPSCGNNSIDAGEQCDGSNLGGQTCSSRGYASGTLSCNSSCQFNNSQCGRNKCGGGGSGNCGFVAGDIGANQCTAPNDAVCTNALICNPGSQSIGVGGSANLNASGGSGGYSWSAPGGSPTSGTGTTFVTGYSTTGTKTITLTSGATSTTCTVNVSTSGGCFGNCSDFLSQNVPGIMESGKTYSINISYQNTGTTTWDHNSGFYYLGSQNPQLNTTWNEIQTQNATDPNDNARVYLPPNPFVVGPNSSHNFVFNVVAPVVSNNTNYNFQWRIRREAFVSEWFGEYTDNRVVQVVPLWSCTATANPSSSSTTPLNGVDVNVVGVGVNASNNWVDCTSDGIDEDMAPADPTANWYTSTASPPNYTINSNCNYSSPGNYTVTVRRQELGGLARITACTASVTVEDPSTLTASFTATPATFYLGQSTSLATVVGGTATGNINYNVWWDCAYTSGSPTVGEAVTICGDLDTDVAPGIQGPPNGTCALSINGNGYKCDGRIPPVPPTQPSESVNYVYTTTGTKRPIVVIERGTLTAMGTAISDVQVNPPPIPSVTNLTVSVNNSNYCTAGPHANITWTYSSSGSPPSSDQAAYEAIINGGADINVTPDSSVTGLNPANINPEWRLSGTTGTSSGPSSGCSAGNADTNPQASCQLTWNTPYTAWVRVKNGYDAWSPWTKMGTYVNGTNPPIVVNQWTTPVHAYPSANFIYSPSAPSVDSPVTFTDTTNFAPGSINRTWSWNFGGGIPGTSILQNPMNTYSAPGSYQANLTAGDDVGSCSATTQTIILQDAIPRWIEVAPR